MHPRLGGGEVLYQACFSKKDSLQKCERIRIRELGDLGKRKRSKLFVGPRCGNLEGNNPAAADDDELTKVNQR